MSGWIHAFGRPAGAALLIFLLGACSSEIGFRRFEVGPVEPRVVYDNAVQVVTEFYTNVHGGLELFTDQEKLRFETGFIRKRSALDTAPEGKGPLTVPEQPTRQKLYFRVISEGGRTDVELFATYEVMAIEDPDKIETEDDMWKFDRQDNQVEDILYQQLLERLVEKNLLVE